MMLLKELSELLGRWDGNGQDPTSNPSDEFWEFMHQQCGRHSAPSWKSHFNKNREIYIEAANIHAKAEEPTQPVEEERGDEVGEGNEVEDSQALRGDLQDDVVTVEIQQRSSENDGEESSSENEEEEEPNSYSRMAEGLDETREELDELGEAQGLEDLASEQVRRMSQPSPELVLERSATGDPAGSRQDQEVDKAPIENDDSSPDLSSKEAAEVEDAVLGPRFSTPQPTSTKPLPTSQHPIGSVDESLGQAPQLAMRKEHHDAKVAAKEDAKRSSRIVDDVLLSPTLGLAAASPARNPSFAAVVARSEIRSEARVTDKSRLEALFPSQPAFLERKAATGMIAPTSSSKPPGGASKEYAEAAVGPSQPSLGNDRRTVHRDSKRQPRMSVPLPVTRRVVSPTEAEQSVPTRSSTILRRKAGRQTISGAEVSLYEKHSRVHKGTPLIPRHRSAAFYDFSIDEGSTDEPEDEKFFVQVPTRGQASSSSKGKGRGPSHWDTDSDEGMGERYRAKRRAPAAAFGSLTSSSSPAKSVGRSMSLALKTEQALGGNGPSSKPVERKPSSSRKGLSDPTKSPKGPTRPRTTTTSARPSLLPPDDALTLAKAKYQASVLELCSDFGLKTPAQAARFLKEVDGDVRSGRRMIEQHVQRIAEEFQVSTKMVIEFVRAADGKWDEAKKFLAVFSHQEREAEEEEEEERTRKRSTSNPVQIQNRTKRSNPPDQDSSLPRVSGQGWRKRPSKQIRLG
ncbi:hypothetical protein IE53DRAFT_122112 [Violaceomyces palustris]|uniref:Uncharacterized protein n=1 Tax=Violaceomyces palustris TaxID=1673888 RepID=A0ACD0NVS3_9BASI|nr:hypothetical protein IE53DRAFT_122112 [Violaceomyces palustris]